jgi:tRNA pseudouridine38-40 synthase
LSDLINLKLIIEYDGKNYFGWQRQSNTQAGHSGKKTIQQTIEQSLQVLFKGEKIKLEGAGRTDRGVHALGQCANVKIGNSALSKFGVSRAGFNNLAYSLNAILPDDIVIKSITRAKDDFHARYSARERTYRYFITTRKHAIGGDKLYLVKTKFDIDVAREFCKLLKGYISFESLCKNDSDKHGFNCDVKYTRVRKLPGDIVQFEICANRFLHSMVRAVTGAMIYAAAGKLSLTDFKSKLKKGEEIKSKYVPAHALFLVKVKY